MYDEVTDTVVLIWAVFLLITVMVLIICCARKYIFKSKNKQPAHPQPICESPPKIVQENISQPEPVQAEVSQPDSSQEKASLSLSSRLLIVGIMLLIAVVLLALVIDDPFCMSEDTLNIISLDAYLIIFVYFMIVISYYCALSNYKTRSYRKAKKGIHEPCPPYLLSFKNFIWHFRIFWGILIAFLLVILALPFLKNSKLAASINNLQSHLLDSINKYIGSINKDTIILICVIIMVLILIALVCYSIWYYSQVERFKQQLCPDDNFYKGIPKAYRAKSQSSYKTNASMYKSLGYFVIFLFVMIIAVSAFMLYKDTDATTLAVFIYFIALKTTGLATLINFTTSPPGKLFHWYEIVFFILLLPLYVLILLVKDQDKPRRHGRRR